MENFNNNVVLDNQLQTGMIMDAVTNTGTETSQEVVNNAITNSPSIDMSQFMPRKPKQMVREHKVGRNEQCPCGSGKKYKKCCLASGDYEKLIEVKR